MRACKYIALLLACNYFAFRVELCKDEYDRNHPNKHDGISFSSPSLNWETFDKDNAPKAFRFTGEVRIECISQVESNLQRISPHLKPFSPVRDKSPPSNPS